MTDTPTATMTRQPTIDTRRPTLARIVNYWAGGKDHFAADRTLADHITAAHPGIPHSYRAARQAAAHTVAALAADGIRQFVDLNPGLPDPGGADTHTIAQHVAPTSTIVYVDHDPLVLAHCRALHTSHPAGRVIVVDADPTRPAHLATAVTAHIDPAEPVAVMATSVAHHLADHHLHDLAGHLAQRLPAHSVLVVTIHTHPVDHRLRAARHHLVAAGIPYHHRSPDHTAALLHQPGLTTPHPPPPNPDATNHSRGTTAAVLIAHINPRAR
ncbi:SAM-dependent methyltransferase [Micromonospora sp. LOL_023]|uniref:SAM-dependent methyltransferase n=1 Tax=Micromonospora sp. LOL_023 TaxID=3345418 RepID=UPI003A868BFF